MFKVQLRDANNRDVILVGAIYLPFIPADHKEVRVRRNGADSRHDTYRVVDHIYEIVTGDTSESGVVVFVTRVG